jgi:DNA processing protein
MDDILSLHRLTVGKPGLAQKLISIYGSAKTVLSDFDVRFSPVSESQAQKLKVTAVSDEHKRAVESDCSWSNQVNRSILVIEDQSYPSLLRNIPVPPLVLFVWGDSSCLVTDQIAVVGSRRASANGISIAEKFAGELGATGFTITSGMALGIDAAAHRGALRVGAQTIAVQAAGAGSLYPARHERLGMNITESGCVLTEYPTGFAPKPYHFPQRNRIVTGLSRGTLVIEAAQRSGSLISARLAMEQGREVFAVPGLILSNQSDGCHQLIRQGAKLTSNLADILEEFTDFELIRHRRVVELSELEQTVIEALRAGPSQADRLHEVTGIAIPQLLACLMGLEIKGEIESGAAGYQLSALA